jgi:hypothetical protein
MRMSNACVDDDDARQHTVAQTVTERGSEERERERESKNAPFD